MVQTAVSPFSSRYLHPEMIFVSKFPAIESVFESLIPPHPSHDDYIKYQEKVPVTGRTKAMDTDVKIDLDNFRSFAPSAMLQKIFAFEIAMRAAGDDERRESIRTVLDILWPEYLASR
jgi:hypothetical protein